jgi:hypothetical protein
MAKKLVKCCIWAVVSYGAKLVKSDKWIVALQGAEASKMLQMKCSFMW